MIGSTPLPGQLQYTLGPDSRWVVHAGDRVHRGSVLARGTCYEHAAASGTVVGIGPAGLVLQTTATPEAETPTAATMAPLRADNRAAMLRRIHEAGIVGLGGGGYPTHLKLLAAVRRQVKTLIVNAVECGPGIRCDAALVAAGLPALVHGIDSLQHLLGTDRTLIACSAATRFQHPRADTVVIEPVRPTDGAERNLVARLTGISLAPGARPVDHGCVVFNVATVHAISGALAGEPLTERIVTVFGENLRVRIGTPLSQFGPQAYFRVGGDLSGTEVPRTAAVDKRTNAVAAPLQFADLPCIRCGACDRVCPEGLPVTQLVAGARTAPLDRLTTLGAANCISCGLCTPPCPSGIDVARLLRTARQRLHLEVLRTRASAAAQDRSGQHETRRLQRETAQAERRAQRRQSRLGTPPSPGTTPHD